MLLDKVKQIIADQFGTDAASVTLDTHLKDDLHADSIELVELAMALEDAFDLELDEDDDLPDLNTVADVVAFLKPLVDI